MMPVRLNPASPRSGVKHSTTEPLCSIHAHDDSYIHFFLISVDGNENDSFDCVG